MSATTMQEPAGTEARERLERLLRDAHICRIRQQWPAAEKLCRQALELSPDDLTGLEMLADILQEKGRLDEALEIYRRCFERQPDRAVLEEQIARLVLRQAEDAREREQAQMLLHSPLAGRERQRNGTIAILLSLLCPGGGHLFLEQYVKGGILLGVGLLSLAFGVPDLVKLFFVLAGVRLDRAEAPPNQALAALGLLGFLVWLYSLLDASAQAARTEKNRGR